MNQNNFNSEINIKKIDNSFKKVGNPKKENKIYELGPLYKFLSDLFVYIFKQEKTDIDSPNNIFIDINNLEFNGNNYNLRLYKANNQGIYTIHSNKIDKIVKFIIYFLLGELLIIVNQPNINYENNNPILHSLVRDYFYIPSITKSINEFFEDRIGDEGEQLTENEKKLLYLNEEHASKRGILVEHLNNFSTDFDEKVNSFFDSFPDNPNNQDESRYEKTIRILLEKFTQYNETTQEVTINKYEIKYEFEIKMGFLDPDPIDVLLRIQDDLRKTLNKRKGNLLTIETKSILKKVKEKSKKDIHKEHYKKLSEIVLNIMNEIEKGELNKINQFLERDIKYDYEFPDEIFPTETFTGKIDKKDKNKKNNLDEIHKKLKTMQDNLKDNTLNFKENITDNDIKLSNFLTKNFYNMYNKEKPMFTEDGEMIEYFSPLSQPHKHTKYGQIIFNANIDNIDDPNWLKDNKDLVSDYSFIPRENRDKIIDSISMMRNSISRTNKFIRDIYSEYKDLSNHEKGNLNNLSNNVNNQNNESIYTSKLHHLIMKNI